MPKPNWFGESIVMTVADPAAGASALIRPPVGTLWHVLSIIAQFVADATVANRYLYIAHVNGVVDTGLIFDATIVAAAGNPKFSCSSLFMGYNYAVVGHSHFALGPFCYLSNAVYLRLGVNNIQAGDQISGIVVTCERMLDE